MTSSELSEFLNNGFVLALDSERVLLGWGKPESSANSRTHAGFYAPDFYLQNREEFWWQTTNHKIVNRSEFSSYVLSVQSDIVNGNSGGSFTTEEQRFQWVEPEFEGFKKQFQAIREGMESRGVKKAVPVVFAQASGKIDGTRRLRILASMFQQPTHLFPYGIWQSDAQGTTQGMMGVTPEILFTQREESSFETVALAGTRAKTTGEDAGALLLADPKERHEHQLVVDDIQKVLRRMGDAQLLEIGIADLPTLVHLKTSIHAMLDLEMSFDDIAEALHPTPALGVAPRELGFKEMRLWENDLDRMRFGAPFGGIFPNAEGVEQRHCVVAIRNIQWSGEQILLGSGCGIVPASDVDREWAELKLKRESVKKMLGV